MKISHSPNRRFITFRTDVGKCDICKTFPFIEKNFDFFYFILNSRTYGKFGYTFILSGNKSPYNYLFSVGLQVGFVIIRHRIPTAFALIILWTISVYAAFGKNHLFTFPSNINWKTKRKRSPEACYKSNACKIF